MRRNVEGVQDAIDVQPHVLDEQHPEQGELGLKLFQHKFSFELVHIHRVDFLVPPRLAGAFAREKLDVLRRQP